MNYVRCDTDWILLSRNPCKYRFFYCLLPTRKIIKLRLCLYWDIFPLMPASSMAPSSSSSSQGRKARTTRGRRCEGRPRRGTRITHGQRGARAPFMLPGRWTRSTHRDMLSVRFCFSISRKTDDFKPIFEPIDACHTKDAQSCRDTPTCVINYGFWTMCQFHEHPSVLLRFRFGIIIRNKH